MPPVEDWPTIACLPSMLSLPMWLFQSPPIITLLHSSASFCARMTLAITSSRLPPVGGMYTEPMRSLHPSTSRSIVATLPSPSQFLTIPPQILYTAGVTRKPTLPHCTNKNSSIMHVSNRVSTPARSSTLPCRSVTHITSTSFSRIEPSRHLNFAICLASVLDQLAPCMFTVPMTMSSCTCISFVWLARYCRLTLLLSLLLLYSPPRSSN